LTPDQEALKKHCGSLITVSSGFATTPQTYEAVQLKSHKLDGPRLGMTYQVDQDLPEINGKKIGPTISRFGWHFEWLVRPEGGGPAFITQYNQFRFGNRN
jgi:hypothetical protein